MITFNNFEEMEKAFNKYQEKFKDIYKDALGYGTYMRVAKISNNPPEYMEEGYSSGIRIGYSVFLDRANWRFNTSVVTEIDEENRIFKTLNSTYKYLILDEER